MKPSSTRPIFQQTSLGTKSYAGEIEKAAQKAVELQCMHITTYMHKSLSLKCAKNGNDVGCFYTPTKDRIFSAHGIAHLEKTFKESIASMKS